MIHRVTRKVYVTREGKRRSSSIVDYSEAQNLGFLLVYGKVFQTASAMGKISSKNYNKSMSDEETTRGDKKLFGRGYDG
jgi:hypothetical protein